jgi:hypothetical protein
MKKLSNKQNQTRRKAPRIDLLIENEEQTNKQPKPEVNEKSHLKDGKFYLLL